MDFLRNALVLGAKAKGTASPDLADKINDAIAKVATYGQYIGFGLVLLMIVVVGVMWLYSDQTQRMAKEKLGSIVIGAVIIGAAGVFCKFLVKLTGDKHGLTKDDIGIKK